MALSPGIHCHTQCATDICGPRNTSKHIKHRSPLSGGIFRQVTNIFSENLQSTMLPKKNKWAEWSIFTLAGPRIMPFHTRRSMSSSCSRPQLTLPSPPPFWPCSSSSSKRKFRGTLTVTHRMHKYTYLTPNRIQNGTFNTWRSVSVIRTSI